MESSAITQIATTKICLFDLKIIQHILTPCPKCGQNLLTEHDYNVAKTVMGIAKLIRRFEVPDDGRRTELEIGLNGTNDVKVDIREQE